MEGGAEKNKGLIVAVVIVVILLLLYVAYNLADVWRSKPKRPVIIGKKNGKNVYACQAPFILPNGSYGMAPGYVLQGSSVCNMGSFGESKRFGVLDRDETYEWNKKPINRVMWGSMVLPDTKNLTKEDKKLLNGNAYNVYVCDAKYGNENVPGFSGKDAADCEPVWNVESGMIADSIRHLNKI